MTKLKLNPEHQSAVVAGFAEFVETVDLGKYQSLQPNRGRVLIKKYKDDPKENTSEGGIVLSGETQDAMEVGVVVAVGEGLLTNTGAATDLGYAPGDVVFIPEHFGHDFQFGADRETVLSILASDIIAKLKQ
ncbi:molecular chaperone GroES [Vibrio phage SHOU24]|uniref:co-chaperonin GroES n=1 Tax=Vibrio phage SHOU24 TaxID=1414739 RepID=UPI0003ED23AB|nr:co-chaperonin GroES [Vibrio phage SHOU24]AHI61250.1 molecular chaperone GroES [Vibrio phage SHOU24]